MSDHNGGKFTDQAGSVATETFNVGMLLGQENNWVANVSPEYQQALAGAVAYAAGQIKPTRTLKDRFAAVEGRIYFRCVSKYHKSSGHEQGDLLPVEDFSPSNVAKLVHTCRKCTAGSSRKYLRRRKSGAITSKPKVMPLQQVQFWIQCPGEPIIRCKNWEEVSLALSSMSAPSAAVVIEGKAVPVKRQIVFVKDEGDD